MYRLRQWLLPCVAVATVLLTACGGSQARYAHHMERGKQLLAAGNIDKASVEFRNALQIQPKSSEALYLNGRVAERRGDFRGAAGLYQGAIDASPGDVDAHVALGRLLLFAGALERAEDIIKGPLAKHPDDPALLTIRAAAKMQLKDPAGAQADVEHALRVAPTNAEAIGLRAGMYRQDGDFEHAIALVSDAVRRIPAATDLREVLANLYISTNHPELAEEQIRALMALKPEESRYRSQLALLYSRAGKIDDAQRLLEEAVKALPNNDEAKLTLADFLWSQRTHTQGEQVLRGFVDHEPDNYDLRLGLGTLLQRSGDVKGAIQAYEEVVRRDDSNRAGPSGLLARGRLANIAVAEHRYADANKLIAEVLAKSPHDNDALTLRGQIELLQKNPADAIADLRVVLRDQPQAVGIHRLLAQAYLANHQPALAEESLRTAMDLAPTDAVLRGALAQLFLQTQRPDQAVALLQESVRKTPTDPGANEALARAYLANRDFAAARSIAANLKTLMPQSPIGSYLTGLAAEGQNQLDEAQTELARALSMRPSALDILTTLARLEVRRGHGAEAESLVKTAISKDQRNPLLWNLLGELYLSQNLIPQANEALSQTVSLAPKWWMASRNLAVAKVAAHDVAGATATYEAAIKATPSEPQLVVELARLHEKVGQPQEAIAAYEDWDRQNPHTQLVANNLAMLLVTYRSDRASLDRARDLSAGFASSDDSSLLDTNGWVHFKRAEYPDALSALERAVERAPNSKEIRYHLGMAELHTGRKERAREDLEAALSGAAPSAEWFGDARTALATLRGGVG